MSLPELRDKESSMRDTTRRMGLGDVVAAIAAFFGIKKLQNCGCTDRQAWLNRHFPLPFRVRKSGDPTLDGE